MRPESSLISFLAMPIGAMGLTGCDEVTTTLARFDDDSEGGGGASGELGSGGLPSAEVGGGANVGGKGGAASFGAFFEAEDGSLSGPFAVGASAEAEGGAFLYALEAADPLDAPGGALARYTFDVAESGEYVLWGRIHSPGVSANRFWFRVDEGAWYLWRISTGEEWFWDDLHDNLEFGVPLVFSLEAGAHQLEVANATTGAELDRFLVALKGVSSPPQEIECNPPHSVLISGNCVNSCGSYGNVTCGEEACTGKLEVVSYDCGVCCLLD